MKPYLKRISMLLMLGMMAWFVVGLVTAQEAETTPEPQPMAETTEAAETLSADEATVPQDEGWLANLAEDFIGLFQRGGEVFASLVVGIVPLLIVLLTGVNALIALIGTERVEKVGEWAARDGIIYYPIRYMIFPFLAVFFLTNRWRIRSGASCQRSINRPSTILLCPTFIPRLDCSHTSTRARSLYGVALRSASPSLGLAWAI